MQSLLKEVSQHYDAYLCLYVIQCIIHVLYVIVAIALLLPAEYLSWVYGILGYLLIFTYVTFPNEMENVPKIIYELLLTLLHLMIASLFCIVLMPEAPQLEYNSTVIGHHATNIDSASALFNSGDTSL